MDQTLSTKPNYDRRSALRVDLLVEVEYEAAGVTVIGRCENISETGLLVKTSEPIAPGIPVVVRIVVPPPTSLKIETTGTVVRCEPGVAMAVRFSDLTSSQRQAIADFVWEKAVRESDGPTAHSPKPFSRNSDQRESR